MSLCPIRWLLLQGLMGGPLPAAAEGRGRCDSVSGPGHARRRRARRGCPWRGGQLAVAGAQGRGGRAAERVALQQQPCRHDA